MNSDNRTQKRILGAIVWIAIFLVVTWVVYIPLFLGWAYLVGFHTGTVPPAWGEGIGFLLVPVIFLGPPVAGYFAARYIYRKIVE